MKRILFLFLIFLPLFGFSQAIIFYDDCEASNKPILGGTNHNLTSSWGSRQGSSTNSSITRSSTYSRKGLWSYRHFLSNSTNDGWQYMKAELAWNFLPAGSPLGTVGDNTAYYRTPAGVYWVAASILIPSSNTDFNTITSLGFNTKPVEDDVPTPTYLAMENGRYYIIITRITGRTQTGSNANGPIYSYSTNITKTDAGPIIYNQWEDWVLNRNYTYSADTGFVRWYKNGQPVATYLGRNWPQDGQHSKEPYYQMGLYKWAFGNNHNPVPNVNQVEMYMDEVRFGRSTATLSDFLIDQTAPPNQPPTANAGASQSLSNSATSTVLSGSASDVDGTIQTRTWTQISGPNTAVFSSTSINTPTVSNLIPGLYKFRFTVTDNQLATAFAEVDIKVNKLPDITFLSPTSYTTTSGISFSCSLIDPDGTVTAFLWETVAGPTSLNFASPNAITTNVGNIVEGQYRIRLTATDNNGESSEIELEITFSPPKSILIRRNTRIKVIND